jgi:hypothetical protein
MLNLESLVGDTQCGAWKVYVDIDLHLGFTLAAVNAMRTVYYAL